MFPMLLEERIKSELTDLYPDGIINNLSVKNLPLHNEIKRIAKIRNTSYSQYLNSLGFVYENKRGRSKKSNDEKLTEILIELNQAFPDKTIETFTNRQLYSRVYYYAKENNLDIDIFLNQQGFYYKNLSGQTQSQQNVVDIGKNQSSKLKYDIDTIRALCTTYGISQKVFSDLFEVSRQAISGLINRENKYSNNWIVTELDQTTLNTFEQMIRNYEKKYSTENEQFFIGCDGDTEQPAFCFFYTLKIENEILCQVLYEIPNSLKEMMIKHNIHHFKLPHLTFLKELDNRNQDFSTKKEPYYLSKKERDTVNVLIRIYPHLFNDFSTFRDFLGLHHIEYKRDIQSERYYNILSSHYLPELDIVKIPSDDKRTYIKISRAAKKRGMGLKEFIESFGFNYKRVVNVNQEQRKEKLFKVLSPYILEDGKIYISSFDAVYTKFYILANKSKRTLTQFLKDEFDLDRYSHINDVPPHLNPKIEKQTYTVSKEDSLVEKIKEFFMVDEEQNTIYIPTFSSFYWELYKYCDSLDQDIDDVVANWGFIRLRKNQLETLEDEVIDAADLVELLSNEQSSINKEEVEISRQKRSQRLVTLLKEMYDYKCQICGDHPVIPLIPMHNGKNYVEVHHIVPLHKQFVMNDESDVILDDYENAIVVCAHHHKVLHYEHNGYVDIIKENDEYYFVNNENKIRIQKNYHLTENDHLVSHLINAIKIM